MSDKTAISWTDATWNPVTGCIKVSEGCYNCYAEAVTLRFKHGGPFVPGNTPALHPDRLDQPTRWKKPRRIFVNSMSDLFWGEIPESFLQQIWQVMLDNPRHAFQVLTKRPRPAQRLIKSLGLEMAPHIWIGVSVENQAWADRRIPQLLAIPAPVRFLSVEPMLGPVDLRLSDWWCPTCQELIPGREVTYSERHDERAGGCEEIVEDGPNWVILGAESGPGRRPFELDWARTVRDQCVAAGVPFFFKQGPGARPGTEPTLDGVEWHEFPEVAATAQGVML